MLYMYIFGKKSYTVIAFPTPLFNMTYLRYK